MTDFHRLTRLTSVPALALIALLAVSFQGYAADMATLPASAEDVTPLKTGDMAPSFTVRTVDNEPFNFDPANLTQPVILISFRGGWCPFCNRHLTELKDVVPELTAKGIDVYFLSGDRPEILYSSLKDETQDAIAGLDYTIFSDADINAATALGIAFKAEGMADRLESRMGADVAGSSMKENNALPVPAVYVIDKSGKIVFDYVNPDFKVRLPTEDLLSAANEVVSN
jgi:peroxiredoxin